MYVITSHKLPWPQGTKFHVHLEARDDPQWGGYWFWRRVDAETKRDELNNPLKVADVLWRSVG